MVNLLSKRQTEAVILVGGKGTRLQSVINNLPKPMVMVGGRPFVERIVLTLYNQGVRRLLFCTGYMSEVVETYFRDGSQWGMEVLYSRDPFPLGTAGAVRNALSQVSSNRFLVLNGDSYCHVNIGQLEEVHLARGARATLWLVYANDCSRYGSVEIGQDGAVLAFHEKTHLNHAGLINAGIYLLEREAVEAIPEGRTISMETEFFPSLIPHGLFAVAGKGPFLDIGTPEAYATAEKFFNQNTLI